MLQVLDQRAGSRTFTINGLQFKVSPKLQGKPKLAMLTVKPNILFPPTTSQKRLQAKKIAAYIEQVLLEEKIRPIAPILKKTQHIPSEPRVDRSTDSSIATTSESSKPSDELPLIDDYFSEEQYGNDLIFDTYQAFLDTTEGDSLLPVFKTLNQVEKAEESALPQSNSYSKLRPSITPPTCPFSGLVLTPNNTVLFRLKECDHLLDEDSLGNAMWIAASKTGVRLYLTQPKCHFPKLPIKYEPRYTKSNDVKRATREEVSKISLYSNNFIKK